MYVCRLYAEEGAGKVGWNGNRTLSHNWLSDRSGRNTIYRMILIPFTPQYFPIFFKGKSTF